MAQRADAMTSAARHDLYELRERGSENDNSSSMPAPILRPPTSIHRAYRPRLHLQLDAAPPSPTLSLPPSVPRLLAAAMRALTPFALRSCRPPVRHCRARYLPNPLRCQPVSPFGSTPAVLGLNRVYQSVRSPADLETLLLQTAASHTPLLTLWTASWCPSCKKALPYVQNAVETAGLGEAAGGVAFAEVEFDAPGNEELGQRYMITSIPTLLAFSRQEAQIETRVTDVKKIMDPKFLRAWIETEALRRGDGGAGGKGPLGKLFDTFGKS